MKNRTTEWEQKEFVRRFNTLCEKSGVSPERAISQCGFGEDAYRRWTVDGAYPSKETIQRLADHFHVLPKELTGETILEDLEIARFLDNCQDLSGQMGLDPKKALMQAGLSVGSYALWQSGSTPSADSVLRLAAFFQVDPEELARGEHPKIKTARVLPNRDAFLQNFFDLCASQDVLPEDKVEELGIKRSRMTAWTRGEMPTEQEVSLVADAFQRDLRYLYQYHDPDEARMEAQRRRAVEFAEALEQAAKKRKSTPGRVLARAGLRSWCLSEWKEGRMPTVQEAGAVLQVLKLDWPDLGLERPGDQVPADVDFLYAKSDGRTEHVGAAEERAGAFLLFRQLNDLGRKQALERLRALKDAPKS